MNLEDFNYNLPEALIGQTAIEPRDSCKLMVVDRANHKISHHIFRDLVDILDKNSVLVLNDTKVFPARLLGKKSTGGKVENLLLKQTGQNTYLALQRGKATIGQKLIFDKSLSAEVIKKLKDGEVELAFSKSGPELFELIEKHGKTPLPPYIHSNSPEKELRQKYQTIYAKYFGSAAAPTAGLHFTKELLENLKQKGIQIEYLTLHVGLGTFKPVTEEQILSKTLHHEEYELTEEVASRLNLAKKQGKKIIAVGTTTTRTLETLAKSQKEIFAGKGTTNIFIQPGYKFKFVGGLITNFHLPQTSLMMLVSAFTGDFHEFKKSLIGLAYEEAIKNEYKFFSFGDAMLIL